MAEVLVAEAGASHRALAQFVLETQGGHRVRFAHNARNVMSEMESASPDLLLLETALAGECGLDLCRQLRRKVSLPIMMVSQRADPAERVQGLRAGADDFLPKPFDPDELLERINALLRRSRRTEMSPTGATVRAGDLRLHLIDRTLMLQERGPIALTPVECRFLYGMLSKPGALWTREQLMQHLWDMPGAYDGPASAVEAHVSRLRRKIERNPKKPEYLITVRGEGYQLNVTGHTHSHVRKDPEPGP
jgi:DNA-binding response OmpR family regulator